jgi:hypothetical protein
MAEETNDMKPADQGKTIPSLLNRQLGNFMSEKELEIFRSQLPEAFLEDAAEGLKKVQDRTQLDIMLKQLNQQMHHQLKTRTKRIGRKNAGDPGWTYWAILIILLLSVCAFLVIRLLLRH